MLRIGRVAWRFRIKTKMLYPQGSFQGFQIDLLCISNWLESDNLRVCMKYQEQCSMYEKIVAKASQPLTYRVFKWTQSDAIL